MQKTKDAAASFFYALKTIQRQPLKLFIPKPVKLITLRLIRTFAKLPQLRYGSMSHFACCLRRQALLEQFCVSPHHVTQGAVTAVFAR